MLDVLRHDNSRVALQRPVDINSKAAKTQAVQKDQQEGGKKGHDSHRKCLPQWKQGRPWLEFGEVEVADLASEGSVLLIQAMFCKWCEMAGFTLNQRGKKQAWTRAGGGCHRLKLESIKEHEDTTLHKMEAANLLSNQSAMKEAVKTAILQEDRVLMNLANIFDKKGPHALACSA